MLNRLRVCRGCRVAALTVLAIGAGVSAQAQSLNFEGQSGGIATPFAYTVESKANGVSLPTVALHMLSAGEIVGPRYQGSVTVGLLGRAELGYTKAAVTSVDGDMESLSNLFDRGFQVLHGKVVLVPEKLGTSTPAISAGFVARYQRNQLPGSFGSPTRNGDVYAVVTKTISRIEQAPVVLSGGVKLTNSSLMGFAGRAPGWELRGFFFAGINLGRRLLVGAEYVQQPREVERMAITDVPGTLAVLARLVPATGSRLSLDVALVSLGSEIGKGLDIKADNRLSVGAAYRF